MLKQRARAVAAALRTFDLAVVAGSFLVAHAVRSAVVGLPDLLPPRRYALAVVLAAALWPAAAGLARLYGAYRTRSLGEELLRLASAVGALGALLSAAAFAAGAHDLSRLLVAIWLAVAFAALAGARATLRSAARAVRRRGRNTRTFAVVGTGPLACEVAARFLARPAWGFRLAGFVLDDGAPPSPLPGPVLGRAADMAGVCERHVLDLVVFAVQPDRLGAVSAAIAVCGEQGVPVKVGLALPPAPGARLELESLEGLPVLSLASGPQDVFPLLAKRAFDVVASGLALIVLAPLLAAIAVAVRLDSRGPVLFRQRRVGLQGRPFTLLKFRSMRAGAERELAALRPHNDADGPVFKMRDDPRVTRVGRVLRRTSLDELPQLWNVLRGEMSLVGPRPPVPEEVRRYERWQRRRLSVKPGLTCTWQVSGRSEIGFRRWMELDLAYIDRWSLWEDLRIVLRTIPAVLMGRGAR